LKRIKSIGSVIRGREAERPIELPDKETETPFQPRIKMGSQELDYIVQAHKNLENVTALAQYAILYKKLGWSPVALDAHTGTSLQVDFDLHHPTWLNSLMDLALKKNSVSLAIRFEPDSRLFVLMVNSAFGKEFLDSLGDWRSPCMARAGDIWENHFLVLPQTWCFSPGQDNADEDAPLSVLGPGRLVAVPPSVDPSSQEDWCWVQPPWEQPPGHPTPEVLLLLEEGGYISRKSPISEGDLPTWEEIYPTILHSSKLLKALLASVATSESYYRTILYEALGAGFRDPRMLQGLLWHAPHGEMRHDPEGLHKLAHWAEEIQRLLSADALNAGNGSPSAEPRLAGPLQAAFAPDTDADTLSLRESPGNPATPSYPENLRNELNFLATLASKLEQQVDELERQQLSSTVEPEDSVSLSLTPQNNGAESEELRRALEKFLSNHQDLLDSK
jgi:hypothetical protein